MRDSCIQGVDDLSARIMAEAHTQSRIGKNDISKTRPLVGSGRKKSRFGRGSNPRPSACKADVITTTPPNQLKEWDLPNSSLTLPSPESVVTIVNTLNCVHSVHFLWRGPEKAYSCMLRGGGGGG